MARRLTTRSCGCPKWCRGRSDGVFLFVDDETIAAGRSDESKGQRVLGRVVGVVSEWSLDWRLFAF